MRQNLTALGAALAVVAALAVPGANAAPVMGSQALAIAAPSNIEPVFFLRCGLFGWRCQHHRHWRRWR